MTSPPSSSSRETVSDAFGNGAFEIGAFEIGAFEKIVNFRDLGGIRTADGRHVRHGQVFRSGAPGGATPADIARLEGLGIRTLCDLRTDGEVEHNPDPPLNNAQHIHLGVTEKGTDPLRVRRAIEAGDLSAIGVDSLIEANRAMVRKYASVFAGVLRLVSEPERRPLVIHCSAGKDRAGLGSAIVLLALGIPEAAVMANYMHSNLTRAAETDRMEKAVRSTIAERHGIEPESVDTAPLLAMLSVRPQYLQAGLDVMREDFGSVDGYINQALKFSPSEVVELRAQLLEPARD